MHNYTGERAPIPVECLHVIPFLTGLLSGWAGAPIIVSASPNLPGVPAGLHDSRNNEVFIRMDVLKALARGPHAPGSPEWVSDNAHYLGVLLHESGHARFTNVTRQVSISEHWSNTFPQYRGRTLPLVKLLEEPLCEALITSEMGSRSWGRSAHMNSKIAHGLLSASASSLVLEGVQENGATDNHQSRCRLAVLMAGRSLLLQREAAWAVSPKFRGWTAAVRELFSEEDWKVITRLLSRWSYDAGCWGSEALVLPFLELWFRQEEEDEGTKSDPPVSGEDCSEGDDTESQEADGEDTDESDGDGDGKSDDLSQGEEDGESGGKSSSKEPGDSAVNDILDDLRRDAESHGSWESGEGTDGIPGEERGDDSIRHAVQIAHDSSRERWEQIKKTTAGMGLDW